MSALTLLREPQFRRIFLAQSVSTLGDQIAPIAVAFAVLATTHSATALGLVPASRTVPLVVFALLGGAWVDRLPRKGLMVTSDLVRLCTQGAFALIQGTKQVSSVLTERRPRWPRSRRRGYLFCMMTLTPSGRGNVCSYSSA